jgi:6-phosphogluconate dehydrogenase
MTDELCDVGLYGLAIMGQNFALNMASHGFKVCVSNRSPSKVDLTVNRAKEEGDLPLIGEKDPKDFIAKLSKPRKVVLLVMAGKPVDDTIDMLSELMEEGDVIIDGGNEWYPNSIRRSETLKGKGIMFIGMGISGGEEGARNGPSLMPGGPKEAFDMIEPIITKCAAQVSDGPCTAYLGPIGSGNYVKMVHNGIEYGDMQLIAEVYDILRVSYDINHDANSPFPCKCLTTLFLNCHAQHCGGVQKVVGLTNDQMAATFDKWNKGDLESYLIEITAKILGKKDDLTDGYVVDKVSSNSVSIILDRIITTFVLMEHIF